MQRILNLCGMTIGGWLGWALGAKVSLFTAFIVGTVGTGVGLYYSQKITRALLP